MDLSKYNIPASIVTESNGRNIYKTGVILTVNENAGSCRVRFGKEIRTVNISDVYLNEGILDKIKKAGSKLWEKIKGLVRLAKGFVVPETESGEKLFQFFNVPVNMIGLKLPDSIAWAPASGTVNEAHKNGLNVINDLTIDEALSDSAHRESEEGNKYWSRIMKEYATNEGISLKEAVQCVNEKYYTTVLPNGKTLNESAVASLRSYGNQYGEEMNTVQLRAFLKTNLFQQLDNNLAAPIPVIWGAPGIGKTSILNTLTKEMRGEGFNLDLIVIKSAAVVREDMTLPDTAATSADTMLAFDVAKSWLPVYDRSYLDSDQYYLIDEFYNSGKFKERTAADSEQQATKIKAALADIDVDFENMTDLQKKYYLRGQKLQADRKKKLIEDKSLVRGGILFFDEISRLQPDVQGVLMNLVNEREYGNNMVLASRWIMVCAANRQLDDNMSETDRDVKDQRTPAWSSRFAHVTFVPTREEWLSWARRPVSEDDPRQNIEEFLCQFIELMGDQVWYDCLEFGSRDIKPEELELIKRHDLTDMPSKKTGETMDDIIMSTLQKVGTQQAGNHFRNFDLTGYNPRTWERQINNEIVSILKNQLFAHDPALFKSIYTDPSPVKLKNDYGEETEYVTQTISLVRLEQALTQLSESQWLKWARPWIPSIDPGKTLSRFAFFMKYITDEIIPRGTGVNSKPSKLIKNYMVYKKVFTPKTIRSIWETAKLDKPNTKIVIEDLATDFTPNSTVYNNFDNTKWKTNQIYRNNVYQDITDINNNYPGGIKKLSEDIKNDLAKIADMIMVNKAVPSVSDKVVADYKNKYKLTLYKCNSNSRGVKVDKSDILAEYDTLFSKALLDSYQNAETKDALSANELAFILSNSHAIEELTNVYQYLLQIVLQTGDVVLAHSQIMSNFRTPIVRAIQEGMLALDATTRSTLQKLGFEIGQPIYMLDTLLDQPVIIKNEE